MSKFYRILWFLAVIFVIVTTITFTLGIVLVGATIAGLFGIYRYYLSKKRTKHLKVWPKGFSSCEVIDIQPEMIRQKEGRV